MTESQDIAQTLVTLLRDFLTANTATKAMADQVGVDTDLITDLEMESIQIMEYVVEIEDHYDISIDLESLSNARTIADLAAIATREMN